MVSFFALMCSDDNNCNNHYCSGCIKVDLSPLLSPHRVIRLTRTIRIIDDGSSKSRERVSKCLCLVITSLLLSKYIDNRRFIRYDSNEMPLPKMKVSYLYFWVDITPFVYSMVVEENEACGVRLVGRFSSSANSFESSNGSMFSGRRSSRSPRS